MLYDFDGSQIDEGLTVREHDVVEIVQDAEEWQLVSMNGNVCTF